MTGYQTVPGGGARLAVRQAGRAADVTARYVIGAARCRDLLRLAVGDADLEPEILSTLVWRVDMAIAERFAAPPLFLVRDAATSSRRWAGPA